MAVTDNRTHLIDGENNNNVSGDTTAAPTTANNITGTVIEGTNSINFQIDDAQEAILFDQDTGESTFSVNMADMTVYAMVKYGLGETFANLGGQIVLGDGADGAGGDIIGYNVVGGDVAGLPYDFGFKGMKLDVSVVVASPGTNDVDYYQYNGTEAGLNHAAILQVGFGSFGLVKAVSTSANAWFDGFYYIANDSYAASITGGTVGTPETMADVVGDDVTLGAGLFNNPKGSEYGIFAPTEWGDDGTADSYFTSDNEQWYFIGDNGGGHAVGATHFPMRLVGNGTGTNSWVITNTVMVNTGTESQFDMSDSNMDTATMDGVTMIDFGTIQLPNATTKTTLNCIFLTCGEVTSNGGDMTGSKVLTPDITANDAGLIWDLNQDPDGELDNMTFTKTSGIAHHAIEFGTNIPTGAITLRGIAFGTDFSSSENTSPTAEAGDETFAFRDTTGTLTVNLVNCTGNFGYYSAGVVITKVVDPVPVGLTNVTEGTPVKIIANETVGTITKGDVLLTAFADSTGAVSLSFDYEGAFDPSGLDVIVRARNQGVAVAAIAEDNDVGFTDETTEASDSTTNDMILLPATPATSDAYYFGHNEEFTSIKLDISTALAQSSAPTFAFEYWNGAWVALSGVTDGTGGLENSGENKITWTAPGDWATTTVNSQGPLFYMRYRLTAAGTITTVPIGRKVTLNTTRYIPYAAKRTIVSGTGLADVAAWAIDTISTY
jgi:hypothetical protein